MNTYFKSTYPFLLAVGFVVWGAFGCQQKTTQETELAEEEVLTAETQKSGDVEGLIKALPSPIEAAKMLAEAGATYNKDLLHDIKAVDKYVNSSDQAFMLGVYGTDLSLTSVFDQTQESVLYLTCVNKLAKTIGVNQAFDEQTMNRIDENKENRDSVLTIISNAFLSVDKILKENGRPATSALIVSGGWVEGLYAATHLYAQHPTKEILAKIGEQSKSLQNLTALLQNYQNDAAVAKLLEGLKPIQQDFAKNEIAQEQVPMLKEHVTQLRQSFLH